MPKIVRTTRFNRVQEEMLAAFPLGIDALETMCEEVKCVCCNPSEKECVEFGKKRSKFTSIVDNIMGQPNSMEQYADHFPAFTAYYKGADCKEWKAGKDTYAVCTKNYDLMLAALKADVGTMFATTLRLADGNMDDFKTMLFTLDDKRAKDDGEGTKDAAEERCKTFAQNYRETKFEMNLMFQACDNIKYYRQVANRHGL